MTSSCLLTIEGERGEEKGGREEREGEERGEREERRQGGRRREGEGGEETRREEKRGNRKGGKEGRGERERERRGVTKKIFDIYIQLQYSHDTHTLRVSVLLPSSRQQMSSVA